MASLPFNRIESGCFPIFRQIANLPVRKLPYENGMLQAQNTLSVSISAAVTAFRGIFVFLPSRHTGNLYNCISKESGYYEKEKD